MTTSFSSARARFCVASAAALSLSWVAACAASEPEPRVPHPEASAALAQVHASTAGRVEELLIAAKLEVRDLGDVKAVSLDPGKQRAIDAEIVAIDRARDRLEADLKAPEEPQLASDTHELESVLQAGAAVQPPMGALAPLHNR
jgi:hypothetical protein